MLDKMINELDTATEKLLRLKQDFADKACPYKVGDKGIIEASSHRGKVSVITKIYYSSGWNPKHTWKADLDIYNKDGLKSKMTTTITHYDELIFD